MTDSSPRETDTERAAEKNPGNTTTAPTPFALRRMVVPLSFVVLALSGIALLLVFGLPEPPVKLPATTADTASSDPKTSDQSDDLKSSAIPSQPVIPHQSTNPAATKTNPNAKNSIPEELRFEPLPDSLGDRIEFLRKEALRVAKTLVRNIPDEPEPLALEALVHNRFGESDKAIECWHRVLAIEPDFADACTGLATIAMDRGEYEKAEEQLQRAIEIQPKMPGLHGLMGESLMKRGRMREAINHLEEDVRLFPKAVSSFFFLGQAHLQLGQLDMALENFNTAIQLDPKVTNSYYGRSNTYRKLGDREKSAESLETFRRLKQQELDKNKRITRSFDDESKVRETTTFTHSAAASVYARNQEISKAIVHWVRATELDPREVRSRVHLVQVFQTLNDMKRVVALLKELRKIDPKNPNHAINLGTAFARTNKPEAAEQSYRRAIELAPRHSSVHATLANFLMSTGQRPSEARDLAKKAVALDPNGQNQAILGAAQANMGDFSQALSSFEKALKNDPQNQHYQTMLRRVQARLTNDRASGRGKTGSK